MEPVQKTTARKRWRRIKTFGIAVVLSLPFIGAAPARANDLVCVTVYYSLFGGARQYVFNNYCQVPTGWDTGGGTGPDCLTDVSYQVCATIVYSTP